MRALFERFNLFLLLLLSLVGSSTAFAIHSQRTTRTTAIMSSAEPHPFCQLPGDPSLILTTNLDLGDKKLELMKGTYGIIKGDRYATSAYYPTSKKSLPA